MTGIITVQLRAIIHNDDSEVLLQRNDAAQWHLPGGCLNVDETTEDGLRRIVQSTTDFILGRLKLEAVYSGERFHLANNVQPVTIVYSSADVRDRGPLVPTLQFFPIGELPHPILATDEYMLRHFLAHVYFD